MSSRRDLRTSEREWRASPRPPVRAVPREAKRRPNALLRLLQKMIGL